MFCVFKSGELYANVCLLSEADQNFFKQHTRTFDGIESLESDQSLDFFLVCFRPKARFFRFFIPCLGLRITLD